MKKDIFKTLLIKAAQHGLWGVILTKVALWLKYKIYNLKIMCSVGALIFCATKVLKTSYLQVDYPNVLCRINLTRHQKWSCRDSNSWQGKSSALTPNAIPLCYRAYTKNVGKNQNYISCWRYFVLYGVKSCRVVSCHLDSLSVTDPEACC